MTDSVTPTPQIGRNEPCPCGSGKKYKRCCGMDAAPKLTAPAQNMMPSAGGGIPGGFDPSQFDPQMMAQFSQMLGRLPKGQLQKLQSLMQKAMSGKDVTREAKDFEHSLPMEFQTMLAGFKMPGMPQEGGAFPEAGVPALANDPTTAMDNPSMSEEEARAIVEAAAKDGKISTEEAKTLLKEERKGLGRFWKKK